MTPIPPATDVMRRPPLAPPTASAYPQGGGGAPGAGGGGESLPRLIFGLKQAVETLVRAVPSAAQEGAQIGALLQAIMVKASGGGGGKPQEEAPNGPF